MILFLIHGSVSGVYRGAADDAQGDFMPPDNEFDDEIADAFEEFMLENDERNRSQVQ